MGIVGEIGGFDEVGALVSAGRGVVGIDRHAGDERPVPRAAGERGERALHEAEIVRDLDDVIPLTIEERVIGPGGGAVGDHKAGAGCHFARVSTGKTRDLRAVCECRVGNLASEPRGATENQDLSHGASLAAPTGPALLVRGGRIAADELEPDDAADEAHDQQDAHE